jgi:hypothetical protein
MERRSDQLRGCQPSVLLPTENALHKQYASPFYRKAGDENLDLVHSVHD